MTQPVSLKTAIKSLVSVVCGVVGILFLAMFAEQFLLNNSPRPEWFIYGVLTTSIALTIAGWVFWGHYITVAGLEEKKHNIKLLCSAKSMSELKRIKTQLGYDHE